jgi:hypothetical protein
MLFIVSPYGFCFNLISLSLSYMAARMHGEKLYIYEKANSISPKVHIFRDILEPNPNIEFIETLHGYEKEKQYYEIRDGLTIGKYFTRKEKRDLTKECLVLNRATMAKLGDLSTYDVAVHCRTGDKLTWDEMKEISLDAYIEKVAAIEGLGSERSVFLMTDNGQVVSDFKKKAPSTWHIFSYTDERVEAYDQHKFNDKSAKQKVADIYQLLKELETAKKCRHFVGTASSNVGVYIILTHTGTYGVDFFPVSLDKHVELFFGADAPDAVAAPATKID